jgi:hypothetical protein
VTTALATIKGALRESNLIAIASEPNDNQQTEGLDKLRTLIASVFGYEVGTKLFDFPIGTEGTDEFTSSWTSADWAYPPQNVRLMVTDQVAQTIYLPPRPDNGARIGLVDMKGSMATYPITLNAGGRLIEGADSLVVSIDDANYEWMYRADTGNWVRLTLIGIDDELPFPIQYDDYFQTMLAMRLNPRYGRSADAQTVATLQRSLGQLRAAYRQQRSVSAPEDVLRMSNTGRGGIADDVASDRRSHVWMR